jgi:hypothetical protein
MMTAVMMTARKLSAMGLGLEAVLDTCIDLQLGLAGVGGLDAKRLAGNDTMERMAAWLRSFFGPNAKVTMQFYAPGTIEWNRTVAKLKVKGTVLWGTQETETFSRPLAGCEAAPDVSKFVQKRFGILPRTERRLALTYMARSGDRKMLSQPELNTSLAKFCREHNMDYSFVHMGKLSQTEQMRLLASSDITIGLHGSDIPQTILQPPRSVTSAKLSFVFLA